MIFFLIFIIIISFLRIEEKKSNAQFNEKFLILIMTHLCIYKIP